MAQYLFKKKNTNTKITETRLLLWLLITAYSGFILKLEMEEKYGIIRMRASIVSLKDDIKSWQRYGKSS